MVSSNEENNPEYVSQITVQSVQCYLLFGRSESDPPGHLSCFKHGSPDNLIQKAWGFLMFPSTFIFVLMMILLKFACMHCGICRVLRRNLNCFISYKNSKEVNVTCQCII